jgi:hypothetical protein
MLQSRRAILKFLKAFQMVCQLEKQKMDHWEAENAALALAVQKVLLQILDWNAFLESCDVNADHHEVAQPQTSTGVRQKLSPGSDMDVAGLDS